MTGFLKHKQDNYRWQTQQIVYCYKVITSNSPSGTDCKRTQEPHRYKTKQHQIQ